jgi:hypothetical protein
LKELAALEEDPAICRMLRAGLIATAHRALAYIEEPRFTEYNNGNSFAFETNWRFLNELWTPQANVDASRQLAAAQLVEWNRRSPRKLYEAQYVREPLFAGWFVILSEDEELIRQAQEPLHKLLTQYKWDTLYYSLFFIAENIYFQSCIYGGMTSKGD